MRLLLCCAVVAGDAKRRRLVGRRRRRECLAAAPQVPARRVVAADLVREAREALRLPYHDPSRYFSVEQDPARGGAVDVYALAGSWPHSNKRDTTTRRRCADAANSAPARRGRLNRPYARRLAEYHRALQLVELGTHLRARLLRLPHLVFLEA